MSPIDPRTNRNVGQGELIQNSKPCRKCSYDLKGLRVGGKCPECGTPIIRSGQRFADNLTDAPIEYLRHLLLTSVILACAWLVIVVGAVATNVSQVIGAGVLAAASLAWWLGTMMVTVPRKKGDHTLPDAILDSGNLRLSIRVTAAAWPLFALAVFLTAVTAGPTPAIAFVAMITIFAVASLISLVPLCVYLMGFADWSGDDGLSTRFNIAGWGIAVFGTVWFVGTVVGRMNPNILVGFFRLGSVFATGLVILALLLLLLCLFQLANNARWAMANNIATAERDERIAERRAQRMAEIADHQYDAPQMGDDDAKSRVAQDDSPIPLSEPEPVEHDPIPLARDDDLLPDDPYDEPAQLLEDDEGRDPPGY